MLVYWLLLAYFAAAATWAHDRERTGRPPAPIPLFIGFCLIWLSIGFRYDVGGDWETYQLLFTYAGFADFGRVLGIGDPGYQALNWLVQRVGGEIWVVNLICGLIFTWGLFQFVRTQPAPWLALTIAVPYLVVVVAMGYTRQAVAIGILLAGLATLERGGSILRFAAYVAAAALFHRTAVAVLPLVVLAGRRNRLLNALAGVAGCFLLYDLFLADSVEGFVDNYIRAEYSSQGAAIRVVMNLVPAVIYFAFHRRLRFNPASDAVWRYFSLASLAMPVLLFIMPSSTAVDRMALYLIPLQLAVLPRVKYLFSGRIQGRMLIVGYAVAVMFVWLNFAAHAQYWLPYRSYFGQIN